uniref:MerR family transcriptional regulator n=1 Tax=Xanthobacter wiegelii TaxID=3119913 RepID=UPI0037353F58
MGDARETEKAPDAFRTISEVADELELPQHVLRFWESRFTQIKPVKRAGGRRFYRPEDVDLLRGIRHLLYTDGFTIKGAQRVLKDQGVRYVQDLGIEREVASMRSARPARAAGGEGVTFGGLLGLLPRRRGKGRGGEQDVLPELPESAELPLPFPDPEADRDLAAEPEAPPRPLRDARARAGGERRDPAFDAPQREMPLRDAPPRDEPAFDPPPRPSERGPQRDDRRRAGDTRAPDAGRREPSFGSLDDDRDHVPAGRPASRQGQEPEGASIPQGRRDPRLEPLADPRDDHPPHREMDAQDTRAHSRAHSRDQSREWDEPRRPPPDGRAEERMEPRLRPMQRPTRGPASRLAGPGDDSAPRSPGLDDPLLPFLDDFAPAPQVSEPIEDRIRRLKAQDRRPPRPHEVPEQDVRHPSPYAPARPERAGPPIDPEDDDGPPEEFLPHRPHRAAPGERRDWIASEPPLPRERDARDGRLLRDGAWQQTDWVESTAIEPENRAPEQREPLRSARGTSDGRATSAMRDPRQQGEEWLEEDRWSSNDPHELSEHVIREQEAREGAYPPAPRQADDHWPDAAPLPAEPARPYRQAPRAAEPEHFMNDPNRSPDRRSFEQTGDRPRRPELRREPPLEAPPAYSQRGAERPAPREAYPSEAYGPAEVQARMPRSPANWPGEAMRRAIDEEWGEGAPQALPRATRVGPLIGPISEEGQDGFPMPEAEQRLLAERMASRSIAPPPASPAPAPVAPARQQPERIWSASAPVEEVAARAPAEPGQRLPREPLRPGPPEQYLPPHLRSEPRVLGQPPMAAPVLSRDDVHRMQSALYELGECRRLMEGLTGRRGAARAED